MKVRILNGAAGLVAALALALGSVIAATASPATVGLYAGGCAGEGHSWLSSPGGYDYTIGCSAGARYLSGTVGFSGGVHSFTLDGAWQSFDIYWGNTGTGVYGSVAQVASTHNLGYLTSLNGYVGTNTW